MHPVKRVVKRRWLKFETSNGVNTPGYAKKKKVDSAKLFTKLLRVCQHHCQPFQLIPKLESEMKFFHNIKKFSDLTKSEWKFLPRERKYGTTLSPTSLDKGYFLYNFEKVVVAISHLYTKSPLPSCEAHCLWWDVFYRLIVFGSSLRSRASIFPTKLSVVTEHYSESQSQNRRHSWRLVVNCTRTKGQSDCKLFWVRWN